MWNVRSRSTRASAPVAERRDRAGRRGAAPSPRPFGRRNRPRACVPGAVRRQCARVRIRLEAGLEAAGVALLGAGERLEPLRDLFEAFVTRGPREARVHLGVLVGLAGDRRLAGCRSCAPTATPVDRVADLGEEVEVTERVAGLALGDRTEQRGDVGVALDVGLLREVEVAAVRLALAREGLLEVLVGLAFRSSSGIGGLLGGCRRFGLAIGNRRHVAQSRSDRGRSPGRRRR